MNFLAHDLNSLRPMKLSLLSGPAYVFLALFFSLLPSSYAGNGFDRGAGCVYQDSATGQYQALDYLATGTLNPEAHLEAGDRLEADDLVAQWGMSPLDVVKLRSHKAAVAAVQAWQKKWQKQYPLIVTIIKPVLFSLERLSLNKTNYQLNFPNLRGCTPIAGAPQVYQAIVFFASNSGVLSLPIWNLLTLSTQRDIFVHESMRSLQATLGTDRVTDNDIQRLTVSVATNQAPPADLLLKLSAPASGISTAYYNAPETPMNKLKSFETKYKSVCLRAESFFASNKNKFILFQHPALDTGCTVDAFLNENQINDWINAASSSLYEYTRQEYELKGLYSASQSLQSIINSMQSLRDRGVSSYAQDLSCSNIILNVGSAYSFPLRIGSYNAEHQAATTASQPAGAIDAVECLASSEFLFVQRPSSGYQQKDAVSAKAAATFVQRAWATLLQNGIVLP